MSHPADATVAARAGNWVARLRGFLVQPETAPVERCELCNTEIGRGHNHLVELETNRVLCACTPCALLFSNREAKHYRRVPMESWRLRDFKISDSQWNAFLIPIRLAFFVRSSAQDKVRVFYPGPAGATEANVNLAVWKELGAANPVLEEFEPDVEALLVNRMSEARAYYRVPIDRCYHLVGLIRSRWHGLSGGEGVQDVLQSFFSDLNEEAFGRVQDA